MKKFAQQNVLMCNQIKQVKTLEDKVQQIVEMGFGEADARQALEKCKGDPEAACNMLLSNF